MLDKLEAFMYKQVSKKSDIPSLFNIGSNFMP